MTSQTQKFDMEVFEEIVKESPGTLRIMPGNGGLGTSQLSSCSDTSDDTVILNYTLCDPVEEEAAAEGSQPKRPRHINYEAKALIEKILSKPGGKQIMQEYGKTKSLKDTTRRQMINILAAEMTETHGNITTIQRVVQDTLHGD